MIWQRDIRAAVILLIVVLLPVGCGTVNDASSDGGPRIYGGTRLHLVKLTEDSPNDPRVERVFPEPLIVALHVIDFPFSLVADTLILPYSIPHVIFGSANIEKSRGDQDRAGEKTSSAR